MPRPSLQIGTYGRINRTQLPDGRWQAQCRYRDSDGVTRSVLRYTPTGVTDRTGAAAERALLAAVAERGSAGMAAQTKVSDLWVEFRRQLVEKERSPRTFESYDPIGARIVEGLGNLTIAEASTQRLDVFVHKVAAESGVGTAKIARTILTGMFSIAVRFGAIQHNPVREIRELRTKRKRRARSLDVELLANLLVDIRTSMLPCPQIDDHLTKASACTVAEFCEHTDLADVVTMFAGTGCRIGELMGVRWSDVDLDARTLRIAGKVARERGVGLVWDDFTKTESGDERVLALPAFAVRVLAERPRTGVMVFVSPRGGLRDPDAVARDWRRVRAALGLDWVTAHSFRRTVATIIDGEGLSARHAADQLGHAQVSMTQDVYFGRGRTHDIVAEALERVLS